MYEVIAITGAGISKASGVPTFEDYGDLRDKLSRDYFNLYPKEFYQLLLDLKLNIEKAKPNDAHYALADFGIPVITMNIDGLHSRAGSRNIVEIHGNLEKVSCHFCKKNIPFYHIKKDIRCKKCNEILEPNIVLYGDLIPDFYSAVDNLLIAKRVLVVGTSFYTSTVCDLVSLAKSRGMGVDIINDKAETEVRKYLLNIF